MPTNTAVTPDLPRGKERPEASPKSSAGSPAPIGRGWLSRVLKALGGERPPRDEEALRVDSARMSAAATSSGEIRSMAQRLIANDRYVFVLLDEAAEVIDERDAIPAWRAIDEQMALIPGGAVPVVQSTAAVLTIVRSAAWLALSSRRASRSATVRRTSP